MQAGHARAAPVPLVRGGRAVHALLDGAAQPARGPLQRGPGAPPRDRAHGLCLRGRPALLQGGRRLAAAPHFADIDLVIPVPLHWTRLRSRGYNQAEILARALADAFRVAPAPPGASERWPVVAGHDEGGTPTASSGAPSTVIPGAPSTVIPGLPRNLPEVRTDLLVRARRTRTQTRVSVDQKARNVASAFQVPERFSPRARIISRLSHIFSFRSPRWTIKVGHDEGEPSGQDDTRHSRPDRESPAEVLASARHILLVDDTFTTGATLYACYAALRPFTTARISIATLAAVEGTPSGGP